MATFWWFVAFAVATAGVNDSLEVFPSCCPVFWTRDRKKDWVLDVRGVLTHSETIARILPEISRPHMLIIMDLNRWKYI